MQRVLRTVGCCVAGVLLAGSPLRADVFAPAERFVGMLADGQRIAGERINDWHEPAANPQLAGKSIFDASLPVRWIVDQAVPLAAPPDALVEFFGGDCLPGRVVDYQPAASRAFENPGEHLIVEPLIAIDLPGQPPTAFVRISTEWLKRIVFERRPGVPLAWRPGTVFLHDGSSVGYRVIRWSKSGVSVLSEAGVQSLLFSQIAEIHFPKRNGWDVWFEQLGVLAPKLTGRLIQLETSDGVRITTSTERFRAQHSGDKSKSENWYPLLQPAWCLDPVTLPFRTIRSWRFFAPDALPLTVFEAEAERTQPVFSSGWNPQRDRAVQDGPLKNNQQLAGWGFGVHAPTELRFPLHPIVTGVRARVGLDQVSGPGGCVRAGFSFSNAPQNLFYRSDLLIGTQKTIDTNWVNIGAQNDPSIQLVLVADPSFNERPKGADPYDIRDCLDWIEPEWRVDRAKLELEIAARLDRRVPALLDWTLTTTLPPASGAADEKIEAPPGQPAAIQLASFLDESVTEDLRYRLALTPAQRFVRLSRLWKLGAKDRWLALSVSRLKKETPPATVQIRVNGATLIEQLIPERTGRLDPDPIVVPLSKFAGQTVRVDVIALAETDATQLDWRGAAVSEHPPGLMPIFDEDGALLAQLRDGEGEVRLATDGAQHGAAALVVSPLERANARIPGMEFAIREYPQLGEYRLLQFAWRKEDGKGIGLRLAHDGQLGLPPLDPETGVPIPGAQAGPRTGTRRQNSPRRRINPDDRGAKYGYEYSAGVTGSNEPTHKLDRNTPTNWVVNTRDVFGEFGAFDLTGLGFVCPDGTAAWFDQIYLARNHSDFDWIREYVPPPAPTGEPNPNLLDSAIRPTEFGRVVSQIAPQFSTAASGEPVELWREHNGRQNVFRTMPPAQGKPCLLRAPVSVAAGKQTVLQISASKYPDADWQLIVKADGQELHNSMINNDTVKDGWADFEIDLSRFAGRGVLVEVHNHPSNWSYEHAFWQRLQIVEK